jgi:Tol biopolymer transport system component
VERNHQGGKLFRIPMLGGDPEFVVDGINHAISFSPKDDAQFAFVRYDAQRDETSLIVRSMNDNHEHTLAVRKMPEGFWPIVLWSLDGKCVLAAVFSPSGLPIGNTQLVSINVNDSHQHITKAQPWSWVGKAVWVEGGHSLLIPVLTFNANGPQIWQVSWPDGEVVQITHDGALTYDDLEVDASLSQISAVRTQRQADIWISVDGHAPDRDILIRKGNYFGLAWTTSGNLVSQRVDDSGRADIWSMGSRTKMSHRLTDNDYVEESPVASADGQYLVYGSRQRDGTVHLWRVGQDGGKAIQLTFGRTHDQFPTITPDGQWVLYSSSRGGHDAIWKISINGGEPTPITAGRALKPSISPDGDKIACLYRDTPTGPLSYSTLKADTGQPISSFANIPVGTTVRWSHDGKNLLYVADQNEISNVWSQPIDGGKAEQLTHYREGHIFALAPAPDGRSLALIRGGKSSGLVLMQSDQ